MDNVPSGLTRLASNPQEVRCRISRKGTRSPLFLLVVSLLSPMLRWIRRVNMIQRSLHQQLNPISHSAERQGY